MLIKTEFIIFIAIIGASMGSFLNVVAHRSIQGRSWWGNERSICESCGHVLSFFELIPIFSWLIQKGRCKKCGERISSRYLFIEIITAFAFVSIAIKWEISCAGLFAYIGTCGIILNSLTDIESGEIFDIFTITFGIFGIILRIFGGFDTFLDGIIGALTGWGIFALIIFVSKGGMGWGDASFMAGIGCLLGFKLTLLAFYIGIMSGGFFVLILLLFGKLHWGKGESIPLVPFLAFGCFIVMIFGPEILNFLAERFIYPEYFASTWPFIKK